MARYFYQLTAQNPVNADLFQFETAAGQPRVVSLAGLAGQIANIGGFVMDTRTITAGNGMSGGGSLAANRTITLGTPGTLSGSTSNAVQTSSHTHALSTNLKAWDGYHPDNAFVDKGTIPGSVDLNDYRTTGIYHQNANADATSGTNYPANSAGMLTVYESSAMTYQTYQIYNTGDVYTRSRYNTSWSAWKLSVDGTTTISAGNGLSGGGTLAANRTITLGTPGQITATSTNSVTTSSHTHALNTTGNFTWSGANTFSGGFTLGGSVLSSPTSANQLRITSNFGYVNVGPANSSWCHFSTDMPKYHFDKAVAFGGGAEHYNGPRIPKTFVQSGDPGSSAATGDLWIW